MRKEQTEEQKDNGEREEKEREEIYGTTSIDSKSTKDLIVLNLAASPYLVCGAI